MYGSEARRQPTPTLVYAMGLLLFFLGAMGFFSNLQWVLLSLQRSLPEGVLSQDLARHLEMLGTLEEQIPLFTFWVYYGLVLHSLFVFASYGLLRFSDFARRFMQILLATDALAFLSLVVYYQMTKHVPRIVEHFHMRFVVAASRIVFLIFLGSPAFMESFRTKGKRPKDNTVA
ncbi:MAG TPA: hypothetical protein PKH07_08615 [bacterium]|nr:hypothetical protein [bacterium]